MIRALLTGVTLATLVFSNSAIHAAENKQPGYQEKISQLAKAYESVFGFTGSIKVVKADEPIFEDSYGLADRSYDIKNSVTHRVSINSISKTFTAAAVMLLVESDKIDLNLPISQYVPELTASWKEQVTAHHLLTHTSGLPRESGIHWYDEYSLEEQVEHLINHQNLMFEPGDRYEYSNSGITLLGRIIENLSGLSFAQFITDQIIKPLNLQNTGVYEGLRVVKKQAVPYRVTTQGVASAQRTKHLGENAGGGMYSTVGDLYQFVIALEQYKLMSKKTTSLMFSPHIKIGDGDAAAYGWTLKPFGNKALRFASGSGYGTKSVLVRDADSDDFIAVTSNWGNTPILPLMASLFMLINDLDYEIPDHNVLAKPSHYLDALGRYFFKQEELRKHLMTDSNVMILQDIDGRLFLNDELLAKKDGDTLGLTYTNEIVIELKSDRMVISVNGNKIVGQKRSGGGY